MKAHGALNVLIHAALLVVLVYVLAATLALADLGASANRWLLGFTLGASVILVVVLLLPVEWPAWLGPKPDPVSGVTMGVGILVGAVVDAGPLVGASVPSSITIGRLADLSLFVGVALYTAQVVRGRNELSGSGPPSTHE